MNQKSNSTPPSNNTSEAFSGKPGEIWTPTPTSTTAIRKDVDRAMGNTPDIVNRLQDTATEKLQGVKDSIVGGADRMHQTGQKAIEITGAYATSAVNATGRKVREVQDRIDDAKSKANDFIQEDPVRAVTYAAIGSAVLTAALIGIFRRR